MKIKLFLIFIIITSSIYSSDHGIYLKVITNSTKNLNITGTTIVDKLTENGFNVLQYRDIATPDIVREEKDEMCGFKVKQILFTKNNFTEFLVKHGNKYLTGAFLKISIYENEFGVQVNIADPETTCRILFNDLYENDEEEKYNSAVEYSKKIKSEIVGLIHSTGLGENVELAMEPIRSDEDLAESGSDMFMMVGPVTYFTDEDQFPIIYRTKSSDIKSDLQSLIAEINTNLSNQTPSQDDVDYRLTKSDAVLLWEIIGTVYSPDSTAVLLGFTRPRTEGLSFHIAGNSRMNDENKCPGIDHAAAYPIEVVIYLEDDEMVVRTARQMGRMDMYFWDAGMAAFMDHMSMPSILDESLRKTILKDKYIED